MLKKILFTSAVAMLVSNAVVAAPVPYVGAGLGITANSTNKNEARFTTSSFRGLPFNVFAGYGGVVSQNFYLGSELNLTIATGELSNNGGISKTTHGYSVTVLPGVMISDHTLVFARTGLVRSRFSFANATATGGQVGLGLQTTLTQNVDLRGEYDYTAYRSIHQGSISTAPRTDAFNVGLVYKFD